MKVVTMNPDQFLTAICKQRGWKYAALNGEHNDFKCTLHEPVDSIFDLKHFDKFDEVPEGYEEILPSECSRTYWNPMVDISQAWDLFKELPFSYVILRDEKNGLFYVEDSSGGIDSLLEFHQRAEVAISLAWYAHKTGVVVNLEYEDENLPRPFGPY